MLSRILIGLAVLASAHAQNNSSPPYSSWPHIYPGQPKGDYSPKWQDYFEVTHPMPNVTFPLPRNYAGNIGVSREGHPNNTLFFWAFEKEAGSLASTGQEDESKPWGIWLNGGPGSSSLTGLMFENGPIHVNNDYSLSSYKYSWDKIADYVWVDQPVGVGFATADIDGWVADEDQMGTDFVGFLRNLVKVFPGLAKRPLHITGESYAGTYIPYITKAIFQTPNPPVKLAQIAIGDGTIGNNAVFEQIPTLHVIETYPQIIGYDPEVYEYFKEQNHLCQYDLNLTYPQDGKFPTANENFGSGFTNILAKSSSRRNSFSRKTILKDIQKRAAGKSLLRRDCEVLREEWKRDLTGRPNGTIDPFYGCFIYFEMTDYAVNFTFPWSLDGFDNFEDAAFDVYNVPDATNPEAPMDATVFLNNNRTRAAIHAPTSKDWVESYEYPFNSVDGFDPSPEPMVFLDELAANATKNSVSVVIYSGNDDSLVPHFGSEVVIQNTTFGGIQGFTQQPATPWYDDEGNFAGIVHQERNWTYVLIVKAGHLAGYTNPESAFIFVRDFCYGGNKTGLVTGPNSVVGGTIKSAENDILPGQGGIFYGSGTTASTYFFPAATVKAWNSFAATAIPPATTKN